MALFYFDIDDNGDNVPDHDGTECAGLVEAKKEATNALVDIIRESLPDGDHHTLAIAVRDTAGTFVLRVALTFDVDERAAAKSPSLRGP